jgi:hypothetical protein
VNDVRFALLEEYAKSYDTATEEQADSFIKRWPAFEKVISHKNTAMFFQIDRRVSMLIELQPGLASPTCKTIVGVFTRFCGKR